MRNRLRVSRGELLALVAIIALLGVTLFPVYARARQSRSRELCAENLRLLALAMLTYAAEWDDRLPTYCDGYHARWTVPGLNKGEPFLGHCWWHLLVPYLKDINKVRFCPSTVRLEAPEGPEKAGRRETSYGFNCQPVYDLEVKPKGLVINCESNALGRTLGYPSESEGVPFSLSLGQISNPPNWVMLCDSNDIGWMDRANQTATVRLPGICTCNDQCGPGSNYRFDTGGVSRYRHGGGPNVAFGDGHVKWFPYREIISNSAAWHL